MAGAELTWDRDGRGLLVKVEGENATVRATKPSAPGSRPFGMLVSGTEIRLKVHRCQKKDDADGMTFTIEGRLLDATRVLKKELSGLLGRPTDVSSPVDEAKKPDEEVDS